MAADPRDPEVPAEADDLDEKTAVIPARTGTSSLHRPTKRALANIGKRRSYAYSAIRRHDSAFRQKLFLRELVRYGRHDLAERSAEVSRQTWRAWYRYNSNGFASDYELARDSITVDAEDVVVGAMQEGNLTAAMFWLNNNHPNYSYRGRDPGSEADPQAVAEAMMQAARELASFVPEFDEGAIDVEPLPEEGE